VTFQPPAANCPECGRPVPPQGLKLCPHCGYPLLLDRPEPVREEQHKIVHKPVGPDETPSRTGHLARPQASTGMYAPPPRQAPPPPRAQPLGPHCPVCRHVNPPHRKRCETCAAELWPGAAAPPRWMPEPPAVRLGPKRKSSWWKMALLIGIPLVAMGTVWALAYFL
jgi:hypothetical protein